MFVGAAYMVIMLTMYWNRFWVGEGGRFETTNPLKLALDLRKTLQAKVY